MQLRSAPNRVRTVDMASYYTCRDYVHARVSDSIFGHTVNVTGIAWLITDYMYCEVGHRRQCVNVEPCPPISTNEANGTLLDFFPSTRRCEWNATCGSFTTTTVFKFDHDGTCTVSEPYPAPAAMSRNRLIARPGVGISVYHVSSAIFGQDKISCHNSTLGTGQKAFDLVDFPKPQPYSGPKESPNARPFSSGNGVIYVMSQPGGWREDDVTVWSWDTNATEDGIHHSRWPTRENVILYHVLGDRGFKERLLDLHVSENLIWISTSACDDVRAFNLYCLDSRATRIGHVTHRLKWNSSITSKVGDHGYCMRPWERGCNLFAVSDLHQVFAVVSGYSNDVVTIYDVDTFETRQCLRTGISDRLTAILKFRFIDLPDAGGPVLVFLVETRANEERQTTRSYALYTFLC